jgi:hypothetical protein
MQPRQAKVVARKRVFGRTCSSRDARVAYSVAAQSAL